jgi:hypothetical protein
MAGISRRKRGKGNAERNVPSTRDGMEIGAANATATRERMVMMENCMIIDGRLSGSE